MGLWGHTRAVDQALSMQCMMGATTIGRSADDGSHDTCVELRDALEGGSQVLDHLQLALQRCKGPANSDRQGMFPPSPETDVIFKDS